MTNSVSDTVIIGLGLTGISCARFFAKRQKPFTLIDSRENPPKLGEFKAEFPQYPLYTGGFPRAIISKARTLILSPGISKELPEIKNVVSKGAEIIGDIELFAREVSAPVVAITGSNGKSTVTSLLGEMAKASGIEVGVGGNLGPPALSLLSYPYKLYILELSSFQLEVTYSLKPVVASILNLSLDHMDRYPNMVAYFSAKKRIYQGCRSIVVNREDRWVARQIPQNIPSISFGLDRPIGDHYGLILDAGAAYLAKNNTTLMPVSELKLFGRHNIANALSALAMGDMLQLPMSSMLAVLKTFTGLSHRCEWVREWQGVQWINDSKGTNVGATLAALKGLAMDIPGKWVLIAGGVGKNADFTPLQDAIVKNCRAVVLIGEAANELKHLLQDTLPCYRAESMIEAVFIASKQVRAGDGVLLSPACASFDMFQNFEHRGNVFKESVSALK